MRSIRRPGKSRPTPPRRLANRRSRNGNFSALPLTQTGPSALPHVGPTNRVPIHARRTVAFVPVASFRHFPNSGNEKLMIPVHSQLAAICAWFTRPHAIAPFHHWRRPLSWSVHPTPLRRSRVSGGSGVHVERSCGALDDLPRNHDLLDAVEARQIEHSVKE